ncbi:MAG: phosphotransferase family protein [Phenylobacterium sp.]|uniref:phosphotransferase family protein n=1 Tax=Phenylobacterium sp. TaxID=1871053 RepID=UPI001A61348E|nr:phosphotransferase family protein [Phenylobacterium sp.]MBL8552690.1 phosphotransferase family protein [Phenylobacterium sp.]
MAHPLEPRLAAYIAGRMPEARGVVVSSLERISGGASRETYRFVLSWSEDGAVRERRMILRRDPPASLIDTERRVEFEAYRAFRGSPVPVPEMLWLEEGHEHLDHPFFVAEEIAGFQASPQMLFATATPQVLARVAEGKWTILGEIAKADPEAVGLTKWMESPALDACWTRELDHWEGLIDKDQAEPLPITRAAIRWLRANPPPPAQKLSVVHGDFRTGNFLYDPAGEIHGVLDWEMSHLGDPLEDLGWSLQPVWAFGTGCAGGLASQDEAIAIWERASGLEADPAALHWWILFNCVKAQGIWVGSAAAFNRGGNTAPIMIYPAWWLINAQDRAMLRVMGKLA